VRIWDVEPAFLCDQDLLGEHRELHAVRTTLTEGKRGYANHPGVAASATGAHSIRGSRPDRRCKLSSLTRSGRSVNGWPEANAAAIGLETCSGRPEKSRSQ
jgi:hypothetical protein